MGTAPLGRSIGTSDKYRDKVRNGRKVNPFRWDVEVRETSHSTDESARRKDTVRVECPLELLHE